MFDLLHHRAKHLECLALVFLLRGSFCAYDRSPMPWRKMIHRGQVFLPVMIELPQHHLLFGRCA